MERRHLLKAFAGLALCPICASGRAFAEEGHHWDYSNQNWGGVCGTGDRQSPIDIKSARPAALPALQIAWGVQATTIANNGHTIQVNCGGTLRRGNEIYTLQQFHFHHPSEHRINGKVYQMEVHFVHARQGGGRGVVAAFMTRGALNQTFHHIANYMPAKAKTVSAPRGTNPKDLLPASLRYYTYPGSLTTPTPTCEQDVTWMVLAQPITAGVTDIAKFAKLFPGNARRPQPIKSRTVQVSS